MKTAVVIPAFNEEQTISSVVSEVLAFALLAIVVDDGSSDKTAEKAEQAGATVLSAQHNLGYDGAINRGFEYAAEMGFDCVITMDGDGQHPGDVLPEFLKQMQVADCVVGFRSETQRWSERFFASVTSTLWGIRDPLCGMKAYNIDIWRENGAFDTYKSCGTELLIRAIRTKRTVKQYPVPIVPREDESRFGGSLKADVYILKAMLKGLFKRF
ncbi:glycosyltransferase family 2 protein [Neptuniibacter caesariensis]|uniref:Glycosyltransferase n=1 Tax=Neptuniibacter caesariensis TaxID=207954 RepID=A0A7U8C3H2_NEPCE|nr:glycosyltransferase [Neptuniibacter caesariensis]EAR60076.1 glycosyltransferase [Oceanospirillum sp. MED92] [Neptuniibacter caesariensis]